MTSGVPFVASSPFESSPTRGRSTPSTPRVKAAPMKANWTRCSARTSALAPASSSVNGCSGTGTDTARAGPVDAAERA